MNRGLADLAWPVATERLSIRPAVPADAAAVWDYRRLDDVAEWMGRRPTDRAAYVGLFDDADWRAKMLVIEREGAVVGDLYVAVEDAWAQEEVKEEAAASQAEIGWVLHPDHQGQGLAREAVTALLGICFDADRGLGLRRVIANCFADNEPSWRLMDKLGMRREAHNVRDSLHRDRGWLDGYSYALLADEWRSSGRSTVGR